MEGRQTTFDKQESTLFISPDKEFSLNYAFTLTPGDRAVLFKGRANGPFGTNIYQQMHIRGDTYEPFEASVIDRIKRQSCPEALSQVQKTVRMGTRVTGGVLLAIGTGLVAKKAHDYMSTPKTPALPAPTPSPLQTQSSEPRDPYLS
jgi:hypothetical protein